MHGLSGTPSAAPPKRGSMAGAMVATVSGTPSWATACGASAGARLPSERTCVGEDGSRLAPGTLPCGIARPGTPVPVPPGPASGEPGGAGLLAEPSTGAATGSAADKDSPAPLPTLAAAGVALPGNAREELGGKTRERRDIRQARGRIRLRQDGRRRVAQRVTCRCRNSHGTCRSPRHPEPPARPANAPRASSTARSGTTRSRGC